MRLSKEVVGIRAEPQWVGSRDAQGPKTWKRWCTRRWRAAQGARIVTACGNGSRSASEGRLVAAFHPFHCLGRQANCALEDAARKESASELAFGQLTRALRETVL